MPVNADDDGGGARPRRHGTRHAAVVCNPAKVDRARLASIVAEAERRHGWDASVWFETSIDDPGVGAAEAAAATDPEVVIVAGGDGTVRVVAGAIHDRGIPLALVPRGTGNLLARNLGLPLVDMRRSVDAAFAGIDRPVDLASARLERADGTRETHPFLVMAGIGIDAAMAANTDAELKRRIGWAAYVDPIARSILGGAQFHARFQIDGGRPHSVRAHTVITGNCGTLTANLLLLPDAVVDDGLLDVVLMRPRSARAWVGIGSELTFAGPLRATRVGRWVQRTVPTSGGMDFAQARRFDIRFPVPQRIQLDGDDFGEVVAARLTVAKHAVTLRVPTSRRARAAVDAADAAASAEATSQQR